MISEPMALDAIQWIAMVVTLVAAWLVASRGTRRRRWGFWTYLLSNVLWTIWGWNAQAYALIVLQIGLAALNLRGVDKNEGGSKSTDEARRLSTSH